MFLTKTGENIIQSYGNQVEAIMCALFGGFHERNGRATEKRKA